MGTSIYDQIHNSHGPHHTLYIYGIETFIIYIVLCQEEDQNLLIFDTDDQ